MKDHGWRLRWVGYGIIVLGAVFFLGCVVARYYWGMVSGTGLILGGCIMIAAAKSDGRRAVLYVLGAVALMAVPLWAAQFFPVPS